MWHTKDRCHFSFWVWDLLLKKSMLHTVFAVGFNLSVENTQVLYFSPRTITPLQKSKSIQDSHFTTAIFVDFTKYLFEFFRILRTGRIERTCTTYNKDQVVLTTIWGFFLFVASCFKDVSYEVYILYCILFWTSRWTVRCYLMSKSKISLDLRIFPCALSPL